ncbi:hypothetical protein LXA43DRAFT_973192 [Ganoderma leucocontextum]|nr:hypothetical protein LXA43DRAFT_973192 [Ganoderma leucocontextum]
MQLFAAVSVAFALLQLVRAQSVVWGQCGGIGWTGATTCVAGSTCTSLNVYYSQCLPGASAPTTTAPAPPTMTAPTTSAPGSSTTAVPGACSTPGTISGFNNSKLPNPFLFDDNTPVQSADDWTCRRAQIQALLPGPPSSLTASLSGNTLSITASNGNSSITFKPTITFPSGTPPADGWPLVIVYDSLSIPVPSGIATMIYGNSEMAQQNDASSRGLGLFYTLYGESATASAMTAWAWGVSRIIDALEKTPSAHINTKRIAVTGCSRDGKGALMAGALEPRIALTIPQESGSGGDTCWRLSLVVQTATEIVTENVWFSSNFASYVDDLSALPYDHHMLAALVAPRAMISFENTDYVWLSPLSAFGCMSAAHAVWGALGVADRHGFEQVGGHAHCAWPAELSPQLNAFFDRFLLDQPDVNTTAFATNGVFGGVTWTASDWIDWTTPTLK